MPQHAWRSPYSGRARHLGWVRAPQPASWPRLASCRYRRRNWLGGCCSCHGGAAASSCGHLLEAEDAWRQCRVKPGILRSSAQPCCPVLKSYIAGSSLGSSGGAGGGVHRCAGPWRGVPFGSLLTADSAVVGMDSGVHQLCCHAALTNWVAGSPAAARSPLTGL
jgi:hypothetical protein